jgi:hypothetical protein
MQFRGLAVITVGDMYQYPPVNGTALYTSITDFYLRNKNNSALQQPPVFNTLSLSAE